MVRKISMVAFFVVLAATLLQSTFATNHTVGESTGWLRPSSDDFYEKWADNNTFVVGDVLVFNFATGQHDVAEVKEADYDNCGTTNTISTETRGPARIPLNTSRDYYFICTIPGHCSGGQKLKVEVKNGNSSTPTPGSSPSNPTGVSPPGSLASSLVATLSLVFWSIVLVLSCY